MYIAEHFTFVEEWKVLGKKIYSLVMHFEMKKSYCCEYADLPMECQMGVDLSKLKKKKRISDLLT